MKKEREREVLIFRDQVLEHSRNIFVVQWRDGVRAYHHTQWPDRESILKILCSILAVCFVFQFCTLLAILLKKKQRSQKKETKKPNKKYRKNYYKNNHIN